MIGKDYRAIRRFNLVKQKDIAYELGYEHTFKVLEVEESGKVPHVFVEILSKMLNLDLTDDEVVRKECEGIPERYFKKNIYNRKPRHFPAVFVPR